MMSSDTEVADQNRRLFVLTALSPVAPGRSARQTSIYRQEAVKSKQFEFAHTAFAVAESYRESSALPAGDSNSFTEFIVICTAKCSPDGAGNPESPFGAFFAEAQAGGYGDIHPIGANEDFHREELLGLVKRIADRIPEGVDVLVDVSRGLRHFPFIQLLAALVLKEARKDVRVMGVYSCAYELKVDGDGGFVPILDLSWLIEATDLISALAELRAGRADRLVKIVESSAKQLASEHNPARSKLLRLSANLPTNLRYARTPLPLELGLCGKLLPESPELHEILRSRFHLFDRPLRLAVESLDRANLEITRSGAHKGRIRLTEHVLEKHLELVRYNFQLGDVNSGLNNLREWCVNRVLFGKGIVSAASDSDSSWIDNGTRHYCAERPLNALAERKRMHLWPGNIAPEERAQFDQLGESWANLRDARNKSAHAGMMLDNVGVSNDYQRVLDELSSLSPKTWNLSRLPGVCNLALLTSLGRLPGSLASFLMMAGERFSAEAGIVATHAYVLVPRGQERQVAEEIEDSGWSRDRMTEVFVDARGGLASSEEVLACWEAMLKGLKSAARLIVHIDSASVKVQVLLDALQRKAERFVPEIRRAVVIGPDESELQAGHAARAGRLEILGLDESED